MLDELGCCCTPGAEGCDSQVDVGAQAGSSNKMFCSSAHRVAVLASYLNRTLWRSLSSGRAKVVVPWMRRMCGVLS